MHAMKPQGQRFPELLVCVFVHLGSALCMSSGSPKLPGSHLVEQLCSRAAACAWLCRAARDEAGSWPGALRLSEGRSAAPWAPRLPRLPKQHKEGLPWLF